MKNKQQIASNEEKVQCSKEVVKIRVCFRCNTEVEIETVLDYPYFCPECDENMYEFETSLKDTGK